METIERYGAHTPKKKHGGLTVVLIILAVLLAAAVILSWLAFSDPYAGKGLESVKPSENLVQTLAKSAVTGQECSFPTDEVNGYLAYLFQKHEAGAVKNDVQMQTVAVANATGKNADLYIPVLWHGKRFGVLLNVTPSLDTSSGRFLFRVNSVNVGRLPVPVGLALKKIESRLPKGLSLDGDTVSCEAPTMKLSMMNISASASITEFHVENGALKLAAKVKITVG